MTELSTDLRAYLEEFRGDLRTMRDDLSAQIQGVAGAQKTLTEEVTDQGQRLRSLENRVRTNEEAVNAAKRSADASKSEFDASATGLARILADKEVAAEQRHAAIIDRIVKVEKTGATATVINENRAGILGLAILIVVAALVVAGKVPLAEAGGAMVVLATALVVVTRVLGPKAKGPTE